MKNENSENGRSQNGSRSGLYILKALSQAAALINLGSMPMGSASAPLVLWLLDNEREIVSQRQGERGG
ncbi:MAG TPA: hypothetical protein PKY01_03235 [Candidatus Hydrogenedentes bacterium]|nr:hypothetical protein [Candidatus Hydrogenedentota bacterium]HQH51408.1 hypothetical protein [Candidatus Hydrogenedentota bacterium]HQM48539.1 hypothetical protein [Candidatus Hydrogenedentota bacterium]